MIVIGIDTDPLILAAKSYEKLINKNFDITIDTKDGNTKTIQVQFKKDNFYHLIGFHYLKDLPQLNTRHNKKNKIFNNVLQGSITYSSLKSSSYFDDKMNDRVSYFHNIDKLLFEQVILDFDSCNISLKTNLKCNYMFFKNKDGKYMHLSLAQDKNHYPESFFVRNDNIYIKNQDIFNIVSIKEIKKNKPKKAKKASNIS
ncbi:MAG: PBECR4 domain-containing protein [Bacilli bacterium]